ncbi:MAG: [protein-PII] uridylyltransferase [Acidimicrobiales bacterium]
MGTGDGGDWVTVGTGWSLRARRQELAGMAGLGGLELCRRAAEVADEWLGSHFAAASGGDPSGLALFAVGGLGRQQLMPGSDLDLLLVHDKRRDAAQVAERIWYPIWDDDIGLDHSLRTPKEVLAAADADLRVALGLLDARLVAGDPALAATVTARTSRLWEARRERWLGALIPAVRERHHRYGDVAFLLEPDLKEGRGGLRDVHALRAAASVTPVLDLSVGDTTLDVAAEALMEVLVALQGGAVGRGGAGVAARTTTRLLLQDQDGVAAALGLADADVLMARVAAAGRAVAWASDGGWRRVASWIAGPGRRRAGRDRPAGPGLAQRDDELVVLADADPARDPSLAFRLAGASVDHGVEMSSGSLARLAQETPAVPEPWPDDLRYAFVRLLGMGSPAVAVIETLDQWGLVVRLLPEWAAVRNRPQRNAYHRYTVDRHLLETAAGAAGLVRRVERPDLLLVAALLHDIGKGAGGDHSEAGAAIAERVATRMGFPPADVATIAGLARHHLVLPDVATRRDLDDPATIPAVAAVAGDRPTLDLLAALTEADSLATGPAAWGPWKAGLVAQLVRRAGAALGGEQAGAGTDGTGPTPDQQRLLSGGALAVAGDDHTVTVAAPDRPGLLGVAAGVLALHGVEVRSATSRRALGSDSPGRDAVGAMALISFEVAPAFDVLPEWTSVEADIGAALEGRLALAARLADKQARYRRWSAGRASAPAPVEVLLHQDASDAATVVEVRAPDTIGLLSRAAAAITDAGREIVSARAVTLGGEAIDSFYVRGGSGAKLDDGDARVMAAAVAVALRSGW